MAKRKKLAVIVEAVSGILGDDVKYKKLKKKKALRRFIEKMEAKQQALGHELETGNLKEKRTKELQRHAETLEVQIEKAKKILRAMEAE